MAEIARTALPPILESGRIPEEIIALMQTKEYSKENFDLLFSVKNIIFALSGLKNPELLNMQEK